jgi:dTMP kinase
MFVVLDGIDGCGKSTVTRGVVARLQAQKYPVVSTAEPYQTTVRTRIADGVDPAVALSLFLVDRDRHVTEIIQPNQDRIVVSDRYALSTAAYQGYLLRYYLDHAVMAIHQLNQSLFPTPDRTYLIDVPVDVALARVRRRHTTDPYERRDLLTQVRTNFLDLAATDPSIRVLDGTRPPADLIDQIVIEIVDAWNG